MISPGVIFYFFEILFFWAVWRVNRKKLPKMKNNNYMCHVAYLKDSIGYDQDFWYTFVK